MFRGIYLVGITLISTVRASDLTFPPGFKFGVASSAYQVEGGWNASDKSESVWDKFTHTKVDSIADHSNGDIACDSYHRYKEDVQLMVNLGVDFYRFSISWARVLPTGSKDHISADGVKYYNELIDELLRYGIEPLVTMYHLDLPHSLQALGGWTNPKMIDWFGDYAKVLYTQFGDRVKTWITINEPLMVCDVLFASEAVDTGNVDKDHASYLCSKITLLAHATAWRIYDNEFRNKFHGKVSLANHVIWMEGRTAEDHDLGVLLNELGGGRFSHPVFSKKGGWPQKLEDAIRNNSMAQGLTTSRLPAFTPEEIQFIKGTYDFYALNYYTARVVYPAAPGDVLVPFPLGDAPEFRVKFGVRSEWKQGAHKFLPICPECFRKTLTWINDQYGPVDIIVTENGISNNGRGLEDEQRIDFLKSHLEQILLALEDGINISGYTYWSLMDNFEWFDGYRTKFGLYEVDFEDPKRSRTARKSAKYYKKIIETRSLDNININSSNSLHCFIILTFVIVLANLLF